MKRWSWSLLFTVIFAAGAGLGLFSENQTPILGQAHFASTTSNSIAESQSLFSCPNPELYQEVLKRLKVSGKLSGNLCDEKTKRGRFARTLHALAKLKTKLPDSWKGGAREALESPVEFMSEMTETMGFDWQQKKTIAYNRQGQIFIGKYFFEIDELESLTILIHEARHSDPNDPMHATCTFGSLPLADGACDEFFRTDEHSGAYAYGVSFAFGAAAYNPKLTRGQKEFLLTDALSVLATRFNIVPEFFAVSFEMIRVLDTQGNIFEVHPLTGELMPVLLQSADTQFKRIEFLHSTSMLGFSNENGVFGVGHNTQKNYFDEKMPIRVHDLTTMAYAKDSQTVAASYYIDLNDRLMVYEYDPEKETHVTRESSCQLAGPEKMRRLALARKARYTLSDEGQVYRCDEDTSSEFLPSNFVDPSGFLRIYGGIAYDRLYGITQDGRLRFWDDETKTIKESAFKAPAPFLKYQESRGLRAALLNSNQIMIRSWDLKTPSLVNLPSDKTWVDMAVLYNMSPAEIFMRPLLKAEMEENFHKTCGIQKVHSHVWGHRPWGLNAKGQIVEGIFDGQLESKAIACKVLNLARLGLKNESISTVRLQGSPFRSSTQAIPEPRIEITQAGKKIVVRPYFFK